MICDTTSPPGSWRREIDFRLTTTEQLRAEIAEQRKRIAGYVAEIERLRDRVRELEAREQAWVREP